MKKSGIFIHNYVYYVYVVCEHAVSAYDMNKERSVGHNIFIEKSF